MAGAGGPGQIHPLPPAGERRVEEGIRGRELDLVVPAQIAARVEEDLHDVGPIERLVIFGEGCGNVRVLRLEGDVKVVVVPEQTRDRLDGAGLSVQGPHERTGALRPVPCRLGQHAVDGDRPIAAMHDVLAGTPGTRGARSHERDGEQ